MIEIGDEIVNWQGKSVAITSIEKGKHGLLGSGHFTEDNRSFYGFFVYELPPTQLNISPWYGWANRATTTLVSGHKLGTVAFSRTDPRTRTIEEHDKEWERTVKEIQAEEVK